MSSQQGDIGNAGERCRQLRPNVLQHCADTGLVDQYKSFQKRNWTNFTVRDMPAPEDEQPKTPQRPWV